VPAAAQAQAIRLARELLERRSDFPSDLDWESWAAERLRQAELSPTAGLFQITHVARVLDGLGQPELRDAGRVAANLAARWGLHKMVTGGEQVNRFMPFFKAWLIRQALAEAARRHAPVDPARAIVVLTAEYKPGTQDGRFSVGLRKFKILAGIRGPRTALTEQNWGQLKEGERILGPLLLSTHHRPYPVAPTPLGLLSKRVETHLQLPDPQFVIDKGADDVSPARRSCL
jgi:hypothetical protein